MIASDRGSIVNISTAIGLMAAPGYSAYNTSKYEVRGFTE
ncbi:SDR family NAD(P)-dependent oxidoreductase [Klebsiella quasipneumoniae]